MKKLFSCSRLSLFPRYNFSFWTEEEFQLDFTENYFNFYEEYCIMMHKVFVGLGIKDFEKLKKNIIEFISYYS